MTTLEFLAGKFGMAPPWPKAQPMEVPGLGREDLSKWLGELGFREGVEIGVMEGLYSEQLLRDAPRMHLTSIDPWLSRPEYRDIRRPQRVFDEYERVARLRLGRYPNSKILKMKSVEASRTFADKSLDFVYVDGHHDFLPVAEDLSYWSPKIRSGGIMAGHDYARFKSQASIHVVEVLHAWTWARAIRPWFVLGRRFPPPGEHRDLQRSWLWVMP